MALINYLTQVQFGYDVLGQLAAECQRIGITRPFIVTDTGVRAAGIVDKVLGQLADPAIAEVFDQTPPNPNEGVVRAAAARYRNGGFDGIIASDYGGALLANMEELTPAQRRKDVALREAIFGRIRAEHAGRYAE